MSNETRTVSASGGEKGVKPEVFDQFPIDALFEIARVFGYGADKYEAHNFRRGYEWSKSFNAMMRHAFSFWNGETYDPESGRHHLAHAAWHCMNLIQYGVDHPEFDDRYTTQQEVRFEPTMPLPFPEHLFEAAPVSLHELFPQIADPRLNEGPRDLFPWRDPFPPMPVKAPKDEPVEDWYFDEDACRWFPKSYISDQEWAETAGLT